MRRLNSTKPNYLWLKVLIILSVIATAYLLITRQYLILAELVICIIGGYIAYKFIVRRLENPRPYKPYKVIEQPQVTIEEIKEVKEPLDIKKFKTDDLIKELTRRGEIR
jgi:hypothetical protein